MSKEYILQNIILPNIKNNNETSMYMRCGNEVQQLEDGLSFAKNAKCDFSTYFNAFSLNKWLEYTNLDNLHLCLNVKGCFKVEIYTSSWFRENIVTNCIYSKLHDNENLEEIRIPVNIAGGDNIYFSLVAIEDSSIFAGGHYGTYVTNESVLRPVEIDLVMCTFKREAFIKRNIKLLKESFFEGNKYNAAGHYHIKVVDNGQTLLADEIETKDGSIKLYPNLNVGGSGGFARGMMESLKENSATHILFMDDDVLIQMEALERTYNLLRIIKDDYKDAFLGGAMLRLDMKHIQHENLAAFKGAHLISYKGNLNLKHYKNVIFNEKYEHTNGTYGAWWYCCMPKQMLGMDKLPYPFFVRMDDMEYSIRSPKKWMSLNGISVWHEAFDRKYSTLMENYFMFKNMLVVNAMHTSFSLKQCIIFMLRRFAKEIFRYDYGGAELLLDGVERFLEGPKFFQTVDTVEDLKQHGKKQAKVKPLPELKCDNKILDAFLNDLHNVSEGRLKKLIRFATINGHLLPDFIFKDRGYAEYGYTSNSKHFFCRRNVLGCDLNFDTGVILKISRIKCLKLVLRYVGINIKVICSYARLRREYKESFAYMTSEKFWNKYLKIG